MGLFNLFSKEKKEKLDRGIFVTRKSFFSKIADAIRGKATIDEEVLDKLEEILITSDVGVDTTMKIIERIQARAAKERKIETSRLNEILKEEISGLLSASGNADAI